MNQTAPKTTWIQGLIFSLLGLAMWCLPHSAHADLRSLIKDLQQCQRSGQQLNQCQQNKQALTNQIQALQKQLAAKNSQIAKLRRKLGLAPDPKEMAKRFANHPAAAAERTSVTQLAGSPSHGANDALVTIVEFSDFQCPYCSRGAKVMDQVKKAYGNKVRIVFKHLPLSFHKQAHIAAQASMEAHAQGKFWQYHDKLFANSRNINKANLIKWAKELGLDATKMKAALDSGKYKAVVNRDLAYSQQVGARGTPNFFVNGRKIAGALPFNRFKQIIDQEFDLASKLKKAGVSDAEVNVVMAQIAKAAQEAKLRLLRNMPEAGSPTWGPANAKIRIYEYSDFQCPYCARGAKTIDQIKKAYGNKVRIIFKHNPLSFHKQAHIAAQASMAAHAQGKFWAYHDKLFANYRSINKANLIKWAKELGLDVARFKKEVESGKYKAKVDADMILGGKVGVRGTPNFYVNGVKVAGAYPFSHFQKIINKQLGTANVPTPSPIAPKPAPIVQGNTKGAPSWGPKTAKVTIFEYSDFQCPFCNRGANIMKQVKKAYGNKVRIVFKHRPLSFHQQAHIAAQASMAAHAQGKFWAYHDKLFANSRNINKSNLIKWAKELGLNVSKFTAALDKGTYKAYVDKDNTEAVKVGASGTPTFIINGQKVVGAQPFNRFKAVIDRIISGKAPAPRIAPTPKPAGPANTANAKRAVRVMVKATKDDASWGPTDALVTIVKFTDFQCPFCSRGANTMKQVRKAFKGKVRIVYKHNPLPFHRQAHIASQAALAANAQGKFWQYHDKLFANYRSINKANLIKWAKELGLDTGKFKAALDNGTYKAQVNRDLAYGRTVGVRGTPNFFVNGRKVAGAYPFNHFQKIIREELALADEWIKSGVPRNKIAAKFEALGRKAAEAERLRKLRQQQRVKAALAKLNSDSTPSWGSKNAPVTIVEFSDFQCPYCSRGAKVMDQVKKAYGNKVRIVFKHLPLSFHKQAHIAAQASMEAHAQGKFWQYHDKLFANSRSINKANLIKWAKELGLDATKMKAALDSGKHKKYVDNDLRMAGSLGVRGTPNFFVNGQKIVGAQPFSQFKQVIDSALRQ